MRSKPLVTRDTNIHDLIAAYDTMDFTLCGWETMT